MYYYGLVILMKEKDDNRYIKRVYRGEFVRNPPAQRAKKNEFRQLKYVLSCGGSCTRTVKLQRPYKMRCCMLGRESTVADKVLILLCKRKVVILIDSRCAVLKNHVP